MKEDQDIQKLILLREAYVKQKARVVAVMHWRIKKVGLFALSDYLKVNPSYLSNFSRYSLEGSKRYISYQKLMDVYKALVEVEKILEPEGNSDAYKKAE